MQIPSFKTTAGCSVSTCDLRLQPNIGLLLSGLGPVLFGELEDGDLVLKALRSSGFALQCASARLQDDAELAGD